MAKHNTLINVLLLTLPIETAFKYMTLVILDFKISSFYLDGSYFGEPTSWNWW